jgi:hypothetical protein
VPTAVKDKAHGDGRIEWFARLQHPEANHQQLAHRGHDDLFGLKATSVLQARDVARMAVSTASICAVKCSIECGDGGL